MLNKKEWTAAALFVIFITCLILMGAYPSIKGLVSFVVAGASILGATGLFLASAHQRKSAIEDAAFNAKVQLVLEFLKSIRERASTAEGVVLYLNDDTALYINKENDAKLREMMRVCGFKDYRELLNWALSIFQKAVEEHKAGWKIISIDYEAGTYRESGLAVLQNITPEPAN